MNLWAPIDALGKTLRKHLDVAVQLRVGVICTLIAIPLFVMGFFVDEPFLVYQMSAGALLVTGICIVIAAVPSETQ